ncbi:MAG: hypothetical protein FWD68_21155 [Alphaproteobacteria bacterium]|nr:hypothetical protein [Alphaproteobacteria bacterium]
MVLSADFPGGRFLHVRRLDAEGRQLRNSGSPRPVGRIGRFCMSALLAFLLSAIVSSSCRAEGPPSFPDVVWPADKRGIATLKKKPVAALVMGRFRAEFEKTKLEEIRQAASAGEIRHQGDGADTTWWLCYTNVLATRVERIWLMSGEMGGGEYVTELRAQLLPGGGASAECPSLPDRLKPLSLDSGLWLGAEENAVVAKLGAPLFQQDGWWYHAYEGKVPGACEGGFDLISVLRLQLSAGRVMSLSAAQVTSC